MNPEFKKNLWLELTLHKLIATPILLAVVIAMALLLVGDAAANTAILKRILPMLFWMFTSLGGCFAVASAMYREHDNKTWDWVRLNSQPVWNITWGIILGASSFMWYCGACCLAAYFILPLVSPMEISVINDAGSMLLLFMLAICLQGASMMATCMMFADNGRRTPSRRNAAISTIPLALMLFPFHDWEKAGQITWYEFAISAQIAASVSVSLFAVWSWIGSLRLLRTQLQYRNGIMIWIAFSIFLIVFINGFIPEGKSLLQGKPDTFIHEKIVLYLSFYISIVLAYIMLLLDPPSVKTFSKLTSYIKNRNWRRIEQTIPLWIASGIFSLLILIPILTLAVIRPDRDDSIFLCFSISVVFLLLRDGAIFIAFSYGKNPQRALVTAFIYLFFLYAVIPVIALKISNNHDILKFFLPSPQLFSPLIIFAHAALACLWAGTRILRHQKFIHSST